MTTEEQQAREDLRTALAPITSLTSESLVRSSELGTSLDFSKGTEIFDRTIRLFRDLEESNLDNVPANVFRELVASANEANAAFDQIKSFNPAGQANPAQVRDSLVQHVDSQYQTHFARLSPVIAYSVRKGTDFDLLENQARETLEQINRLKGELNQTGQSLISEAKSALEQVKRAAAEVGVAQHAVHFKEEAGNHKRASSLWLIITAVFALGTIAYGGWNVWYYMTKPVDYTLAQGIQLGVAKLIVFAVLYFGIIWSGRIYRAQTHNFVVNQHRQNALSTFETFVKAASDPQTKDAVLIQATQSIFAPQSTSFSSSETESSTSPKILEIIRGITSHKSTIDG